MKRLNNLYVKIISIENLYLADEKARKGKLTQFGVISHDKNRHENIEYLHEMLVNKKFKTSEYTTFKVYEPKERIVYRLPYYPDRIVHHAILNVLEPIFVSVFTRDSYSCIKNRGIHSASRVLRAYLKDESLTRYCLKLDIRKFYPSVDHSILKQLLRKKIKDNDLLLLLDEIIESAEGLPIGNYLSQYFANFYLSYFDHWIKEDVKVKYYMRYADDIVVLSDNKPYLHEIFYRIQSYLKDELNLEVKNNYQVFPVESRGIDFVGYKHFHTHVLIRKRIKKNFARMLKNHPNKESIASYSGWMKHANCKNLMRKLIPNEAVQSV